MGYIVQTAKACMPSSCKFGNYRRVAVLEVQDGVESVSMISERARGVVRIVQTWEKRHVGTTSRSAYHRALAEANALAARLNAKQLAARVRTVAWVPELSDVA